MKVSGKLPQVQVTLSDEKLLDIIRLIFSISLPDAAMSSDSDDEDNASEYHVSSIYRQTLAIV